MIYKMTQKLKDLKKEIKENEALLRDAESILRSTKKKCTHYLPPLTDKQLKDKWMSAGAVCEICSKCWSWRCKESPDSVCHYYTEDGKIPLINGDSVDPEPDHDPQYETDDYCLFCGNPEERK